MTTYVTPLELVLDGNNPRFRFKMNPSQEDIREYMLKNEDVLVLAKKIVEMDTLMPGERLIVFFDQQNKNYIVLEGNRRTCIFQMLLNRDLIPSEFTSRFPHAGSQLKNEIAKIPVDLVESREQAMAFMAARHLEATRGWSSIAKWRVAFESFKDGKTEDEISDLLMIQKGQIRKYIRNYKLLHRAIENDAWDTDELKKLDPMNIRPDKFIRIFQLTATTNALKLKYDDTYSLVSDALSCKQLDDIIHIVAKKSLVEDVINTRSTYDDILPFISHILPSNLNDTAESNGENAGNLPSDEPSSGNASPSTDNAGEQSNNPPKDNPKSRPSEGGTANLPYFFDGLRFGHLDRKNIETHGLTAICNEIKRFSDRKSVDNYPIAATYLTRALIEASIKYYSKTHTVQGQPTTLIWERITENKSENKIQLGDIINKYRTSLADFIEDPDIRQYFTLCFGTTQNANLTTSAFNSVVHRPQEYILNPSTLKDLPKQGLLALINYFIA